MRDAKKLVKNVHVRLKRDGLSSSGSGSSAPLSPSLRGLCWPCTSAPAAAAPIPSF